MSPLELRIRALTQPLHGQFPRPWMSAWPKPEVARVFIVGFNQATPLCAAISHDTFIDALFCRNGQSLRELYDRARGEKGSSRTRRNIDGLTRRLAERGISDVLETNVICYSTPMSSELKQTAHRAGAARGREIFGVLLDEVRPRVLIVHGTASMSELKRQLNEGGIIDGNLPAPSGPPEWQVATSCLAATVNGRPFRTQVFAIPSLAPPAWNRWQHAAPSHLDAVAAAAHAALA